MEPVTSRIDAEGIVRVFVSSTFHDMQPERDALVRIAFPELRRRCRERGIEFAAIDLRWGITASQAERGEVLEVCLNEIDRCRPFFVGLLGDRYGWVPPTLPDGLVATHPWLAENSGASITELECIHAALRYPAGEASRAFFYLREVGTSDAAAQAWRTAEPPEMRSRLTGLKQRVRESGLPTREYTGDPDELAALVLEDVWRAVEASLPDEKPTDSDARRRAQRAFVASRTRVYVGRREILEQLDEQADTRAARVLVTGPAGSGKSALLANWVEKRNGIRFTPDTVFYSIAATQGTADHRDVVRGLLDGLESIRPADATTGLEVNRNELRALDDDPMPALRQALARAAARKPVVLVIDGVDQMRDRPAALGMLWLPDPLPEGVSVVLSARSGEVAETIERRGFVRLAVEPLLEAERAVLIERQLGEVHGKRLEPAQVDRIARAPQSATPLFLKTLLEEVRLLGEFERLDATIDAYLAARDTAELVDMVLERCEADYDRLSPGLTGLAMSAIRAASHGLTEPELLEICGIPQALWSPLRMALDESLVSYGGTLAFSHDEITAAVDRRYLSDAASQRAAHVRLADYFETQPPDGRAALEWYYQLDAAGEWQRLEEALADISRLNEACEISRAAIRTYWEHVMAAGGSSPAEAYADVTEHPDRYPGDVPWNVASVLMIMEHTDTSIPMQQAIVEEARASGNHGRLQGALGNLGVSLLLAGRAAEALECHREEEEICRFFGAEGEDELQMCLANMANALMALNRNEEALATLDQAITICRAHGDMKQLARRLGTRAQVLDDLGDVDGTVAALTDAIPALRVGDDPRGVLACARQFNDVGVKLKNAGEYERAQACYLHAEELARELGDHALLAFSIMNRGVVLARMGRTAEAVALLEHAAALARENDDSDTLVRCLFNLGAKLVDGGRPLEAIAPLGEALELARALGQDDMVPHIQHMAERARSARW